MDNHSFFSRHVGITLGELALRVGAQLNIAGREEELIYAVAPVGRAKSGDICFLRSRKSKADLATCEASAILCSTALSSLVPDNIPVLLSDQPETAFALAGEILHPDAMRPVRVSTADGVSPQAYIDPTATIGDNVIVEPFAVVGAGASVGGGSYIGPGSVIGKGVQIGRGCSIAGNASVLCALIGDNVIIHNGTRIGQDGFGYAPGPRGMLKLPQTGRVIIQDDVEIGANTTIDRGAMDDTVIGAGTKIDNLVQIGHNVKIGMHCAIVSKVGIAGSTIVGNGVQIGGAAGLNGHIRIGDGAQIAAMSGVVSDVPAGEQYGGAPARPMKEFLRDTAEILARSRSRRKDAGGSK